MPYMMLTTTIKSNGRKITFFVDHIQSIVDDGRCAIVCTTDGGEVRVNEFAKDLLSRIPRD